MNAFNKCLSDEKDMNNKGAKINMHSLRGLSHAARSTILYIAVSDFPLETVYPLQLIKRRTER